MCALKLTKKSPTAETKVETKSKGETIAEENKTETVAPMEGSAAAVGSLDPWCEVGVEASYTHNLGNYQSCRVQVSLRMPCVAGEINEVFEYSKAWVDEKMQIMMAELNEE